MEFPKPPETLPRRSSASLGKYTINHLSGSRVRHDTRLGAGLGLNYFFTRNIGIGGDAYSEDTTGAFVDSASASLILRLPLGQSGFAPYAFGGGGYQFDMAEVWFAQLGAGMEFIHPWGYPHWQEPAQRANSTCNKSRNYETQPTDDHFPLRCRIRGGL